MEYTYQFIIEKRKDKKTGEIITKNVPISLALNFKTSLRYPTGYRIDASNWIDEDYINELTGERIRVFKVKKNTYGTKSKKAIAYNHINNDLELIKSTLIEVFKDKPIVTKEMVIAALDNRLKKSKNIDRTKEDTSLWGLFDKFKQRTDVGEGRLKTYVNAYTNFKNFECSRRIRIEFEDCDAKLMGDFANFLRDDDNTTGKYDHLPLRQQPRKKGHNTRNKILSVLITFFKWARKNYKVSIGSFEDFKMSSEIYEAPVYLTKEERDIICYSKLDSEHLRRIRDIFIVHCLIGARVGDFVKLTRDNIIEGGNALRYIAQKTIKDHPVECRVPLASKVKEILGQYDLPDGRILPFMSPQKYNDGIKELLKVLNIDRKVLVLNKVTMTEEYKSLYEVVSSHSARKTFIGVLKNADTDNDVIVSMTGHTKGSKAFHKYYKIEERTQDAAIAKLE